MISKQNGIMTTLDYDSFKVSNIINDQGGQSCQGKKSKAPFHLSETNKIWAYLRDYDLCVVRVLLHPLGKIFLELLCGNITFWVFSVSEIIPK